MVFKVQYTYTCIIFLKIQKKKLKIARPDSSQNFMDTDGENNQFDSCVCVIHVQITITAVFSNHTNLQRNPKQKSCQQ